MCQRYKSVVARKSSAAALPPAAAARALHRGAISSHFSQSLSDASKPATNLNDMPDGGVLVAAVSRGSVLFGQQARQFQQANWPRRRTGRYSTRLQLTRPGRWPCGSETCCGSARTWGKFNFVSERTELILAAALALTGQQADAHETLKRYLALNGITSSTIAQITRPAAPLFATVEITSGFFG